jgi:hypothetical protein
MGCTRPGNKCTSRGGKDRIEKIKRNTAKYHTIAINVDERKKG